MSKDVVALFGERELVDSVVNKAGFQQVARVAPGVAPVHEAFYVTVQPIHHLRTYARANTHIRTVETYAGRISAAPPPGESTLCKHRQVAAKAYWTHPTSSSMRKAEVRNVFAD